MIDLKIQLNHPRAKVPTRAHATDAGLDLYAAETFWDEEHHQHVCNSRISVEIPEGHVGLLFSRSSVYKTDLILSNCVGVIDSGYRGDVMARFRVHKHEFSVSSKPSTQPYNVGDRFAQLIIIPYPGVNIILTDELTPTDRGSSGYGSSGR